MGRVLPILFNTDMVRAILDDRKTVTRRIIKPYNPFKNKEGYHQGDGLWIDGYKKDDEPNGHIKDYSVSSCWIPKKYYIDKYAPYHPGDSLYVREKWTRLYYVDPEGYTHYDQDMYFFAADGVPDIALCNADGFLEDDQRIRWRPSIHMPKEIARLWIKVTDVRAERLQDITQEGILAEGIINFKSNPAMGKRWNNMQRLEFEKLWDSTVKKSDIGCYDWGSNPWVWVIEFEKCEKPEDN